MQEEDQGFKTVLFDEDAQLPHLGTQEIQPEWEEDRRASEISSRTGYQKVQSLSLRITKGHCGDTKYTLQSVLVHKGTKSTKGHYYCYTHRTKKLSSEQKELWQYANDEVCKDLETQ